MLPEHIQFIDRPNEITICTDSTDDVVSNNSNIDVSDKDNEVVKLLDPLLENNIIEDVETQEIWE